MLPLLKKLILPEPGWKNKQKNPVFPTYSLYSALISEIQQKTPVASLKYH